MLVMRYIVPAPVPANGVAFGVATLFSYAINTVWSFTAPLHGRTLMRFSIVSIAGCLLAMIISGLADTLGMNYGFGIAAVVCIVPPVSFVLHISWTYRVH